MDTLTDIQTDFNDPTSTLSLVRGGDDKMKKNGVEKPSGEEQMKHKGCIGKKGVPRRRGGNE